MSRYKIIANPFAGGGRGKREISRIEGLLGVQNLDYELVQTGYPGHAVEIARDALLIDKFDVVVAMGGDGTVNEVINGLMEAKAKSQRPFAMGVLCAGRGNDFAQAAGIPQDLGEACRTLAGDKRRMVDIARVVVDGKEPGRWFGNCLGIGFDAIGTIEAAKLKRLGGFMSYMAAVLKTIFLYYRAPLTTLVYDDQEYTQPSLMVSIMNGYRIGGGFIMAPDAEMDDGLLDLCIAGEMSRGRMLALIRHFLKGTQASQIEIKTGRTAKISVAAGDGALPAQIDGEILCVDGERIEVELLPRQLEVIS